LVNLLFHIINAFLVYVLFSRYAGPIQEKFHSWKYILVALIFLVHPINTESVTYLTSRSCVLSLFFMLVSLLCFFKGTEKGLHAGYYVASIVFFFLSLASKRTGIVLIPLLLLFDYFYIAKEKKIFFLRLKYHLPFLITPVLMLPVLLHYAMSSYIVQRPWLENALTELRVIVQYGKLLFVPLGLNIDHDIKPSSLMDGAVAFSILCIAALIALALFVRKKVPGISFGIFWYFLALAPFLAIRVEGFMAERWVYVASIGFSMVIAELVALVAQKHRKTALAVAGACIILLGAATIIRNEVYASPVRLWEDAVQKSPGKPRAYLNLGRAYIESGNAAKAVEKIQTALRIGRDRSLKRDEVVAAYINLAAAYGNDNKKVEEALKSAEPHAAQNHQYHHSLGLLYMRTGKFTQAIAAFQKALELLPNSPTLLNQIGNAYERVRQDKKARDYYQKAVNGIPQNGIDFVNQGEAYLKLGDPQKRLASYYDAVQVDPFDIAIRLDLANILLAAGSLDDAWKQYQSVRKITSHSAAAYRGMGNILFAEGRYREAEQYYVKALQLLPLDASLERQSLLNVVEDIHRRGY
jgi:tetratricopeptide (TPR) repeat protein